MDWLAHLLTDVSSVPHIILVYSLVIAVGALLGRIRLFGVSLGVTFVLFAAIAAGHFGFTVNPAVLYFLRDFGLTVFIYFIGLQVGPSFFSSFKSGGMVLNLLTVLQVLLGVAVTIALYILFKDTLSLPQMLGVHYGAVTNTPGLGATQETLELFKYTGENIAVSYACAYPLGVIGTIGSAILIRFIFRIKLAEEDKAWDAEERAHHQEPVFFHVEVSNRALEGRTIEQVRNFISRGFIASRILSGSSISSPNGSTVLHMDDCLRIVSQPDVKEAIVAFFGRERTDIDLAEEKSPLVVRTLMVTRESVNGMRIEDLALNRLDGVNVTRVFRAHDTLSVREAPPSGGRPGHCVGPETASRAWRPSSNQVKKPTIRTSSRSSSALLGVIVGSVPFAVPGLPVPLKLGLAGGPLIVAILLGRFGPTMRLVTFTTPSANMMMRETGICLFLASVGLAAGDGFVAAMTDGNGPLYMALGVLITVIPLLIVGVIARRFLHINYHSIVGLMAGATTDPPALAYAGTLSERNSSAVAYSTVYPLAMFLRILMGQLILVILWPFL
ncbi:MAG: putative transporter [Sutterella wadsworthensis]